MKKKYHEDHSRSIMKAITFRILILCSDSIIIYAITRRLDVTAGVIFVSNFGSTIIYYFHERLWNGVRWGKKVK